MYGGWVQWIMGEKADGSDSIAAEVASAEHWPEMRVLIAVVSSGPKDVSSSSGMQQSVETSDLLKHRAAAVVPARMERMISAIERKDFPSFAVETIKDSNQFHAVCLDTYPPIFYMNDTSKRIVHLLDNINAHAPAPTVAYTFDAGPNAVIYLLNDQLESTLAGMLHAFQPAGTEYNSFVHDPMNLVNGEALQKAASALPAHVNALKGFDANGVRRIIVSKLGPGPIVTKQAHSFSA
jgi:diphosphomevalonate decarboxylase